MCVLDAFPGVVDYGALDDDQLNEMRELAEEKYQEDQFALENSKKKKRRTLKVKTSNCFLESHIYPHVIRCGSRGSMIAGTDQLRIFKRRKTKG